MTDILLVTVDSLRADHVGWQGYDRPTTPNLDDMATSAHVFENAFAHAGATRPSFPAILTASTALMYGGPERLSKDRTIVSEPLHDAGYATAGFHSNLYLSADFGYSRGFDHFFDAKSDPSFAAKLRQAVKQRLDPEGRLFQVLKSAFEATEKHAGVEVGSAYVDAEALTTRACRWVRQSDPDADHFCWVHYMDVHHPYLPPAEHQEPFRESPVSDRRATTLRRRMLEEPASLDEDEHQTLIDLYDAEIHFVDAEVSRILETVREHWNGELRTFVTADHGEEFREHGNYSHGTLHDEGIHVPLLVDDDARGDRHEELVGLLDLAPTIAGYAGVPVPDNWYGHDLRHLIQDADWPRDSVIGDWGDVQDAEYFYRDHDWKYIRDGEAEELYDLRVDPRETDDVLEENPSALAPIRERVDEHERVVEQTYRDLGDVHMDEETKDRLALLGYYEE